MRYINISALCVAILVLTMWHTSLFAESKHLKIAMIQWRGETEACKGFKDELNTLGYNTDYVTLNANQDRKKLNDILRNDFLPSVKNFDYVYTYGTTVSKMTKDFLNNQIPQIFSNVAAPVESHIVWSMASSGENISGTSNRIPLHLQIEMSQKIVKIKRLGILYNLRERNSLVIRNELHKIARNKNFKVIDLPSLPTDELLQEILQSIINKSVSVDAVYLPLDSFLLTKVDTIGEKLEIAKVIGIGAQKKYVDNGALFGVVPNYYDNGKKLAKIIDRNQKGEKLQNIPIQIPSEVVLMINKTTASTLGISIPESILQNAIIVE